MSSRPASLHAYRVAASLVALLVGCGPGQSPAPAASPAKVERIAESQLATVTLSEAARARLGIELVQVASQAMVRRRAVGATVAALPDGAIDLVAPAAGIVRLADDAARPRPGDAVRAGQVLFAVHGLVSPEAALDLEVSRRVVEEEIAQAQAEVDAAESSLVRTRELRGERAASERDVEDAAVRRSTAETRLRSILARRDLLGRDAKGGTPGVGGRVLISSPIDGTVETIAVRDEQMVTAGATLARVVDARRLLVRVALPAGDLDSIDAQAAAEVRALGDPSGTDPMVASPSTIPVVGDPITGTVALTYEFDDAAGSFVPGQRVTAGVALRDPETLAVVPWSAVVYDALGGSWVYERTAETSYRRRRVSVAWVTGGSAALERGPEPGSSVVSQGAAELLGTEFGAGK